MSELSCNVTSKGQGGCVGARNLHGRVMLNLLSLSLRSSVINFFGNNLE